MEYLINRRTKQHVIAPENHRELFSAKWDIVQADSDGWIAHTGTVCPLPDDVLCEAKVRTGKTAYSVPVKASSLYWEQTGMSGNIVAYRPILTEKLQEPEPIPAPQYDPRSVSFNLLERLKAAHAQAQQIPDLEAELREVLAGMGYDLVARSPFVEPEPAVETPQSNALCTPSVTDAIAYGTSVMKNGKHVPLKDFYVEPTDDMSDWRNWREGDLVEVTKQYYDHCFSIGRIVRIANITKRRIDCEADGVAWSMGTDELRFHSRPAKGD